MQHAIQWFEIPVADMARASAFYETTLQVQLRAEAMGAPGNALAVFPVPVTDGERGATGCLFYCPSDPGIAPSTTGSVVYLAAGPSLDAALDRAVAAGGQVLVPKTQLPPGMGCFAHIRDSEGNRVGLHAPQ